MVYTLKADIFHILEKQHKRNISATIKARLLTLKHMRPFAAGVSGPRGTLMERLLPPTAYDNNSLRLSCCLIWCLHIDPLPERDALHTNWNANIKSFLFPKEPSEGYLVRKRIYVMVVYFHWNIINTQHTKTLGWEQHQINDHSCTIKVW